MFKRSALLSMAIIPFPPRQEPYFQDAKAVIDFARSIGNVRSLTEQPRLELVTLVMESKESGSAEAMQALANLMGHADPNADQI